MVAARADCARRILDGHLSRELPPSDAQRCGSPDGPPRARCARGRFQTDIRQGRDANGPRSDALMGRFAPLLPELILSIGGTILMMLAAFTGRRGSALTNWLAVALLLVATAALIGAPSHAGTVFDNFVSEDLFASFGKAIIYPAAAVAIIAAHGWFERDAEHSSEYAVLIVFAAVGMSVMVSATSLIALYVGLELQSLASYVLASYRRTDERSAEAGLKYFVLGALASGILLYGISLLYGFTGTTSFTGLAAAFGRGAPSLGLLFGLVFLLAGLAFKISAVPFHMWTPDVYEGAPTPVTAFFASAPKVAAVAVFTRVALTAFPGIVHEWQQIVVFVAIASMALGSFAAIGQKNIKRLMAYSSIGHMGFALVGLAAGTVEGAQGVLVYISIYVAMTLGSFAIIIAMRRKGQSLENISDFAGLSRTNPTLAFFFAMLLFSLAGVPPLAGFFAKWYVFVAAIKAGLFTLSVVGVLSSVVGAYYYLLIVKVMYFDEPLTRLDPMRMELGTVLAAAGLFNIFFFVYPGPLVSMATVAAKSLF